MVQTLEVDVEEGQRRGDIGGTEEGHACAVTTLPLRSLRLLLPRHLGESNYYIAHCSNANVRSLASRRASSRGSWACPPTWLETAAALTECVNHLQSDDIDV